MQLWRGVVWLETRKPLKRFLKTTPYCNPKLKLGENVSFLQEALKHIGHRRKPAADFVGNLAEEAKNAMEQVD